LPDLIKDNSFNIIKHESCLNIDANENQNINTEITDEKEEK